MEKHLISQRANDFLLIPALMLRYMLVENLQHNPKVMKLYLIDLRLVACTVPWLYKVIGLDKLES